MILRCLCLTLALLVAAPALAGERLLVFAAASLKTALDRVAVGWEAAGGGAVVISYAGTPALARQIEAGAPADVYIAASGEWMDVLEAGGMIRAETRVDVLGNRLVLVRHGSGDGAVEIGAGFDLVAMLGEGRLAMALVEAVPAGIYGREALLTMGLWDGVAGKVAQTDNVRAALALVASGEAPLGIVYASDAKAEPGVSVVGVFPAASHARIVYPAAVVAESLHAGAEAFVDFLTSEAARAVFAAEGFVVPEVR